MSDDLVFTIVPAGLQHVDEIASLQAQEFALVVPDLASSDVEARLRQGWKETLGKPASKEGITLVCLEAGKVSGFICAGFARADEDSSAAEVPGLEILALTVDQQKRRRGVASRLLNAVAQYGQQYNVKHLQVWIPSVDEQKQRFYQSAGFAPGKNRRKLQDLENEVVEHLWFALLET